MARMPGRDVIAKLIPKHRSINTVITNKRTEFKVLPKYNGKTSFSASSRIS